MSQQITLLVIFHAKPESSQDLQALLEHLVPLTLKETGCIDYKLHVDHENSNVLMLYENWRCEEDLQRHLQSDHLLYFKDNVEQHLAKPMDFSRWQMLCPTEGATS